MKLLHLFLKADRSNGRLCFHKMLFVLFTCLLTTATVQAQTPRCGISTCSHFAASPVAAVVPGGRPTAANQASPKIGFIGDSITAGYNQVGSTITPGTNDAGALTIKKLSETKACALADSGVSWQAYDQGSSGSSTADWLPGGAPSSLNARAKAAFSAAFGKPDPTANPVWVLLMLGTNDVRSDNHFTPKQHQKNLQAITEDLVASGYNVVLNHAPAFVAPTRFNGVAWDASALTLLRSYLPGEQAVAASFASRAPGRVFLGDTAAFGYFAARPRLFQEYGVYGGLHPNGDGGTQALAVLWAAAFERISQGTVRPRAASLKERMP